MAPNRLMGALEKSPVNVEADDIEKEVEENVDERDTALPVTSDDDAKPVVNDVENESEFSRERARRLPIDRGWAWVVLAAAMFYLSLMGGIRKNFGIFFVSFQSRFNSSAALTSSLTTTQSLVTSVGSLIVMTIGMQYMDNRISIMTGSFIMTISCLISAFAKEITILYLSFGFMEGLAVSMIHAPVTAAIGEYFDKKRGFANGLAYSGASFGGLIFAPIITALFNKYGYTGTMMLVGGMAFNMMISGALMRPMSFYDRTPERPNSQAERLQSVDSISVHTDNNGIIVKDVISKGADPNSIKNSGTIHKHENMVLGDHNPRIKLIKDQLSPKTFVRSDSHDPSQVRDPAGAASPLLLRHRAWSVGSRQRTVSETSKVSNTFNHIVESLSRSKVALYSSTDFVYGSVVDIKEVTLAECDDDTDDDEISKRSLCSKIKKSVSKSFRVLFDKSLIKNPVFQLYLFMAFMVAPSNVFLCVSLAPHAKDLGVSSSDIGILMSILSGCGTASRIISALCADRNFVRLTTVLAGASIFVGVFANCVRLFQTYTTLIVFAAVLGFSCELYQAIFAVILVEYLTLAKLRSCLGFAMLIHGASFAVVFQLVGIMRDATGSYYMSFHVLGVMEIVGAAVALMLPIVHRRYTANKTNETDV